MRNKNRAIPGIVEVCFAGGVFFLLFVFFLGYRTPVVSNGDDWAYIAFKRPALPIWHEWNPARILPETVLPLCAKVAVSFVMPICGDYLWSISIVVCVALSLMYTAYICLMCSLLKHIMKITAGNAVLLSALLFLMFFRSWMSPWVSSLHLLHSTDLNCYFFYNIPVLVNGCLVLYLERTQMAERFLQNEEMAWKGFLVLGAYLAIFSNMYSNCVLAVYAGIRILEYIYIYIRRRISVKELIRKNAFYIFVLALWCVCAFYEIHGGRAMGFAQADKSYIAELKKSVWVLLDIIERMEDSSFWLYVVVLVLALSLLLFSRGRHEADKEFAARIVRYTICIVLVTVYLIMLSAVVNPLYLERMEVVLGIMVYAFLMVFVSAAYIIRRCPKAGLFMPFLVFVIGIDVLMGISNFQSTNRGMSTEHALAVSSNMVNQILSEEEKGAAKMELIVPKSDAADNWPYPTYMGLNVLTALRQHGMVENLKNIEIIPDENYYSRFELNEYEMK